MKIIREDVLVNLREDSYPTMKRTVDIDGVINWVEIYSRKDYQLKEGVWSIFDNKAFEYLPLTENIPTWEEEYQEALLAQYPFEKRVREIVEQNVGAGEVMFKLARDFNFIESIKDYFKKLPR